MDGHVTELIGNLHLEQRCRDIGWMALPGGVLNKNLPVDAGDMDSILGSGRFHML